MNTLSPAELLDLPKEPNDRFPQDPFGAADARDRALAAARARAAARIDGTLSHDTNGFAVAPEYVDVETAKQTGRAAYGEMVAYL